MALIVVVNFFSSGRQCESLDLQELTFTWRRPSFCRRILSEATESTTFDLWPKQIIAARNEIFSHAIYLEFLQQHL